MGPVTIRVPYYFFDLKIKINFAKMPVRRQVKLAGVAQWQSNAFVKRRRGSDSSLRLNIAGDLVIRHFDFFN